MSVFPISAATGRPLWFVGVVCAVLLLVMAMMLWIAWSTRHSRVEIGAGEIRLVGDLWGRRIAVEQLDLDAARIVDLDRQRPYRPRRRRFGSALPGYASGWFRLENGEKALVYLTRRKRVLYLPTRDGYALLLSLEEPERALETLGKER